MDLVWIVGCPGSGTTWVWEMLVSHPFAEGLTPEAFGGQPGGDETGCWMPTAVARDPQGSLTDDEIQDCVAFWQVMHPGKVLIEKTPWHLRYLRRILGVFPDSRVVVVHRDPRATVCSLRRKYPAMTAYHAATTWLEAALALQEWLDDPRVDAVPYEALHADGETTVRGLLEHCGLATAWAAQVRAAPATRRLDIGTVDSWREHLTGRDLRIVEQACCPYLKPARAA